MMKQIPKRLHQVWIGPLPMPQKWMATWREKNPEWEYILWDNKKVFGRRWKNQWMIDEYIKKYNRDVKGKAEDGRDLFISAQGARFVGDKATAFAWHVIADIVRYEILYKYGGYMPGADSECIRPIDEIMGDDFEIYLVNTGHLYTDKRKEIEERFPEGVPEGIEKIRWNRYDPINTAPVGACTKGNKFVGKLIEELGKLKPKDLGEAVDTTGNVFMGKMIKKYGLENEKMKLYDKDRDFSTESSFSKHHSGTKRGCYKKGEYRDIDLVIMTDGNSPAIKYVIRSAVKNLEFNKLIIVGEKIKGIKPDIFIKRKDKKGERIKNVARKIIAVAKNKKISKNFILLDDDTFIMKKCIIHPAHKGMLRKNIKERKIKGMPLNEHWQAAIKTKELLGRRTIDYSVHTPFEMNKQNVLDLEKKYKISSGKYLIKTLYGNIYCPEAERVEDYKTKKYKDYDRDILSTIDEVEKTKEFKDFMESKFPNKSKYEN